MKRKNKNELNDEQIISYARSNQREWACVYATIRYKWPWTWSSTDFRPKVRAAHDLIG